MQVRLPQAVLAEMLAHARDESPKECCGLLIGVRGAIESTVRAHNLDETTTRYLIDPKDHLDAMKAARARGLHVIGAYHSHPAHADGPLGPSPSDLAEASGGADFLYVIASPLTGAVAGFFVKRGAAVSVDLVSE